VAGLAALDALALRALDAIGDLANGNGWETLSGTADGGTSVPERCGLCENESHLCFAALARSRPAVTTQRRAARGLKVISTS